MNARTAGFTLIEVVVVLLILTILAGATVPALLTERQTSDDLSAAAHRIESLFRVARDSAIRSGKPVTVYVDSTTHLVWLVSASGVMGTTPDALVDAGVALPPASPGSSATPSPRPEQRPAGTSPSGSFPLGLPASIDLGVGVTRARFTFLPTGAAMGDSLIVQRGATTLVMSLDPWTGDVVAR